MQRLLSLALSKVRAAGEFAESVIDAMLEAIMGAALEFMKMSQGLTGINAGTSKD